MEQDNIRLSERVLNKHKIEIEKLKTFINELTTEFEEKIISVILIGSRARLDFNIGSDIDLIIVGNWSDQILFKRINEIEEKISIPFLPIDFFLYRPDEITELFEKGNPLILNGFTEGSCFYNKDYFNTIQKKIRKKISDGKISKQNNLWKLEY